MKKLLVASSLLPGALLADTASDYVNFVRQIQQDTGVEWDITVASAGTLYSPTGVSADGSFFELWSVHNTTTREYLLDEQFVTSYTPNASIEILTGDPYLPVRRTRSDQPFQVKVTVQGLLDPLDPVYATAPDAAKQVDFLHSTFLYPDGQHSLDGVANPLGIVVQEGTMEQNATATITFGVTNLTGTDLTQVEGEEVFTVEALADFGVSASILDSERVQIWPVAQASFSGIDPTEEYDLVPPMTINLVDLYPSSTTYMRVYPVSDPQDVTNVSASYVVIEDSIPQDRIVLLSDLDRYLNKHGEYVIEILHETPFGTDLLRAGSITVDRRIDFRGQSNTAE